jgi:predicted transcriptional regulator
MTDFLAGIEAFLQSFSPEELAVTREAFQGLLHGRATRVESLASRLNLPGAVVETAIARLVERGTMARDAETGEILSARGLSLTETPHTLTLDGRQIHAFCAVDAVGIPAALHLDARAESGCHLCGAPLTITFIDGVVTEAPPGVVIWATERDLTRPLHTYT